MCLVLWFSSECLAKAVISHPRKGTHGHIAIMLFAHVVVQVHGILEYAQKLRVYSFLVHLCGRCNSQVNLRHVVLLAFRDLIVCNHLSFFFDNFLFFNYAIQFKIC
ncbi:unnamed protein product [Urochloa humidicola]